MNTLREKIFKKIIENGPISLDKYMKFCLYDKKLGYYSNKNPIGCGGDYVTSPEISQMFGELIGLWLLQVWYDQGSPSKFNLIELGPGNGTLMKDILRATSIEPKFKKSAIISLIEKSKILKKKQLKKLSSYNINWKRSFKNINKFPLYIIGNEFFDALPIKQFKKDKNKWFEKFVYVNEKNELDFLFKEIKKLREPHYLPKNFDERNIFEKSEVSLTYIDKICKKIFTNGGVGLFIDYGHNGNNGDSFQSLFRHKFSNPLENIGKSDLSSYVNFKDLSSIVRKNKLFATNIKTQGDFLKMLGIQLRYEKLKKNLNKVQERELYLSMQRLIDNAQMGHIFKVIGIKRMGSPKLPALE